MSIRREHIERVKRDAKELLDRIERMERCAGWFNYRDGVNEAALGKKQPSDIFNSGQYTAAVRRASMDLTRSLVEIRR